MTRKPAIIAIAAAAALSACDNSDHTIIAGPGADEEPIATTNVELPPSIVASNVYRCKDNSLVYVDWLSNDTARIKQSSNEIGTTVTKGEDGAYAAEGQSLTGAPADRTVTINGQSCKR